MDSIFTFQRTSNSGWSILTINISLIFEGSSACYLYPLHLKHLALWFIRILKNESSNLYSYFLLKLYWLHLNFLNSNNKIKTIKEDNRISSNHSVLLCYNLMFVSKIFMKFVVLLSILASKLLKLYFIFTDLKMLAL